MNAHGARVREAAAGLALAVAFALPAAAHAQDAGQAMAMPPAAHPAASGAHAAAGYARHDARPAPSAPARPPRHAMGTEATHGAPASPAARSADYSDGYTYGALRGMSMQDTAPHGMLLLDQLEYARWNRGHAVAIDGQGWYGGDFDKLWVKFEGEHAEGKLQALRAEALWAHAISAYWNAQLGVRHDSGAGPGRSWAAFGVEGLAPYWFDVAATFYAGQGGRTAVRLESEYELRFTQRLILQPRIELNVYGQDDRARGIGAGLSEIDAGLRLRYEVRREFAPYVGVVRVQRFGPTADFARAAGGAAGETRLVAGFRIWY